MNVFRRIRELTRQEERQRWAVMRQEARCTRVTPTYSHMPKGGGDNRREDDMILLTILKDQHRETKAALDRERAAVAPYINKMRDGNARTAMTLRYMKGMRILQICDAMGYSERQVFRILERAESKVLQRFGGN